jgi:hypothetical protein
MGVITHCFIDGLIKIGNGFFICLLTLCNSHNVMFNFQGDMTSLVEDVARIRQVLEANSVSNEDVDEDVLIALLDMHASDKQRVDLVLLELQNLLGKDLIVGHLGEAQRER